MSLATSSLTPSPSASFMAVANSPVSLVTSELAVSNSPVSRVTSARAVVNVTHQSGHHCYWRCIQYPTMENTATHADRH